MDSMAVVSRLAVARVSSDGAARPAAAGGRRTRTALAGVRFPPAARTGRTRRGGAVAASPPTEEAVQMTEPLTKDDLVAYLVSGCKPKENWRSEAVHMLLFLFFILFFGSILVAVLECLTWTRNSFLLFDMIYIWCVLIANSAV